MHPILGDSWDFTKRVFNGMEHCVFNVVGNIIRCMANAGQMKWTKTRMRLEHSHGRFLDVKIGRGQDPCPWSLSPDRQNEIEALTRDVLKCCAEWPQLEMIFSEPKNMKIADTLAICGDRGAYIISISDLQPEYKKLFIDLVRQMGSLIEKVPSIGIAEQTKLTQTLALVCRIQDIID